MKLYANISELSQETFNDILEFCFPHCNKLSIYFPNDCKDTLNDFKIKFLSATELYAIDDELAVLEPKEGFTMVITSLSETVQELLFELPYGEALSFGIIENEDLIFFVSEEGEIAIDLPREFIEGEALFEGFTKIND
ncbi:MAG: hypothetical protein ACLSH8_16760 [Zhenhengia sp.]|jgi:hypothetical protein|uniref:hypothetical protein n=1 Tax=Zhenhengia sp. TaxID=2944208 RepID=UPI00291379C6|nr:hypothetical protein [Clostridiales bacterium]MDU6975856.1 hypothetical protein [Clostridiales bacterium]